ncbi:protein translocase subunit SecF [Thermobispora bispora]|uniref:Protein-export membrane protein SecF n=1 Tax=Thermobispora bispora (strain ATCC 19993 / DSM 43833 / CBS 139.67 / JCM 10125 / KCTC 9307 / NBRC 14880 / R51) TaxID=469371 RepID=D6Y2C3_THEBD|nr:protein translocase subunit SecF [Thermobispora bispora]ADG88772.1 protein-export membrane protein SecF [Thermobispora bispora DSM 43833]MBO2473356.1 protein translocase subunit SecF [Actinomycetales bacterium]MDI9580073.1 protein translocase subunit SecF [Thermobispora sp.]QSI48541.1 protein translocase subunit SecF [Thermobispora bispora]
MAGFLGRRLRGGTEVDFIGRRRLWYGLSAVLLAVSLAGLVGRGLNLGVEFEGGSVFTFPRTPGATVAQVREAVQAAGPGRVIVQTAGSGWRVTTESLDGLEIAAVRRAVAERFGVPEHRVSTQVIGATWGGEVSRRALLGLAVFLAAITLYLSVAFEWRMALAAVVALGHDLVITAGVYAWSGFEVTPATVLGFLTILGYSLYDAVVVFDMIKEVTAGPGRSARMTYARAANAALNRTLVRSLNTSFVAILPVAAVLFVGTTLLGAGTLRELALALFTGMIVGTYSSLCVATPILVTLKEREPRWRVPARGTAGRASAARARAARR